MTFCACGCGENLTLLKRAGRLRRHAEHASVACRMRVHRSRARARESVTAARSRVCEARTRVAHLNRFSCACNFPVSTDPVARATTASLYTRASCARSPWPFSSLSENFTHGGPVEGQGTSNRHYEQKNARARNFDLLPQPATQLEQRIAALEKTAQELQEQNNELALDRALADRECRRLRREADALRRELTQLREEDPKSKQIRALLDHWKDTTNHKRALTPLDGARATAVRRALRWTTAAKIRLAIDGAAQFPYLLYGRPSKTGQKGDKRKTDITDILKTEGRLEEYAALAQQPETAPAVQPAVRVSNLRPGEQPIDAFLSRLDNPKPAGLNKWEARCPAHEDRHASLSVAQGRQGVLAHCHAGCSIENIARAIGLDVADLFDRDTTPTPTTQPKTDLKPLAMEHQVGQWRDRLQNHAALLKRLTELRGWNPATLEHLSVGFDGQRLTLPIRDQNGQLQNVLRYLPVKRENERKLLAMKGRPRDLFPGPETLPGEEFWLFEGEPDAITGHELGLRASALPGVNGWRVHWARRFADRRVIVCLDCDEQGRKAAQRVIPSLLDHALEVRVVDLDPERTDGFDVSDLVKTGGTAQDLLKLALAAGAVVRLGEVA